VTALSRLAVRVRERIRRAAHFHFGPTRAQIAEAQAALDGREYYKLYEDVYRQVSESGGSEDRAAALELTRRLVHRDFDRARAGGWLAPPPARLIDVGCGEGYNALHFARLGYQVVGVDVSPTIIREAAALAAKEGTAADFRVADAVQMDGFADGSFDLATDCGCLHMLVKEDHRRRYLASVRRILKPGAAFFLFQRVAPREVTIDDEEQEILKSVTLVQKRFVTRSGATVLERGCGFRNASLGQYQRELTAAGYQVVSHYHDDHEHRPFAMIVAQTPTA
jgi:SAM-dependent methyltransferase